MEGSGREWLWEWNGGTTGSLAGSIVEWQEEASWWGGLSGWLGVGGYYTERLMSHTLPLLTTTHPHHQHHHPILHYRHSLTHLILPLLPPLLSHLSFTRHPPPRTAFPPLLPSFLRIPWCTLSLSNYHPHHVCFHLLSVFNLYNYMSLLITVSSLSQRLESPPLIPLSLSPASSSYQLLFFPFLFHILHLNPPSLPIFLYLFLAS